VVCAFLLQDKGPVPFSKAFLKDLPKEKCKEVKIDFDGLKDRVFRVPVKPGTFRNLQPRLNGFTFLSRPNSAFPGIEEFFNPKGAALWSLHTYSLEDGETVAVTEKIASYLLADDGKKALYLSGKEAGFVELKEGGKKEALSFYDLQHPVETTREFAQIYRDVWRQIRDFFYDPDLHGKDWDAVYGKYSELVPFASTRSDINYLIGQTIGELCASHEYIIGRGGPKRLKYESSTVGLLGADLAPDASSGLYRFTRILQGRNDLEGGANPLQAPGVRIRAGDYLLAIDGQPVKGDEDYTRHLEGKEGQDVVLKIGDKPSGEGAREYTVKALGDDGQLRYLDQVTGNVRHVEEKTMGRVGYMHLADMDEEGLRQFEEAFRALRYKDGLLIDVRSNGGGFVSWFIIDKLERHLKYLAQTRDFTTMRYPHGVHAGPIVVLMDENTGSDGEVFSQHFKDLKLGTVVGKRTWGGLIGIINMVPLLDGGSVTQSNVGFANLDGEWVVENHGAEPDIEVEQDPLKVLEGQDPQLDFAIQLIQKDLEKHPVPPLKAPDFPVK
jgi:tricorn protease